MTNSIIILMIMAVVSLSACGQNKVVPPKVKTALEQKFPNAQKVKWNKENETEWEAEFKLNDEEYSANYSTDGIWKETEHKIENSAIPANVKQSLDTEFAGYKIEEAEISETANGSVYEFAVEKDETAMEVAISPDGKVVKKEIKTEEKEENKEKN